MRIGTLKERQDILRALLSGRKLRRYGHFLKWEDERPHDPRLRNETWSALFRANFIESSADDQFEVKLTSTGKLMIENYEKDV